MLFSFLYHNLFFLAFPPETRLRNLLIPMINTCWFSPVVSPAAIVWIVFLYSWNVTCLQWTIFHYPTQRSQRKTRKMHCNDIFWQECSDKKSTVQLVARGKYCICWVTFSCICGCFPDLQSSGWLSWWVDVESWQISRHYYPSWMKEIRSSCTCSCPDEQCTTWM